MIKWLNVAKENMKEYNPNWPQIPYHSYWILIVRGPGFGKINALLNLVSYQLHVDNIYLTLKSHVKQNINCQLTNVKVWV